MNKLFKRILFLASIFSVICIAGCTDDIADEITELDLTRLLSPTELDVRVINQTSARLTWRAVKNSTSYVVEFYQNGELNFEGSPVKVVEDVLYSQLPLIVPGFEGQTEYSVRVKAIGQNIDDSKWTSGTFITDPEQILFPIDPEEITADGVTLRWPAGEAVTHILIEPGEINRPLSDDEIASGVAVLSGLESETEYTAYLMNEDRIRGTATFTTLIDTGNAILVGPDEDLKAIIEGAEEGDIFALLPGDYIFPGNIYVNTTVDVVASNPLEKPVLYGVNFRMVAGSGLRLKDLILDGGTAPDGNQTVVYDEVLPAGQTYGDVFIEDCVIRNYVKGVFYVNIAALIESVTFRGNIYHSIETAGGDFIDFRNGMTKTFDFINNTVYNSALGRDIFRMDAGGSTNFPGELSVLTIRNNTFHNVVEVDNRRILYIRLAEHQIYVSKNIFSETLASYSNQSATTVTSMDSNNYWNAPNLYNPEFIVHDSGNFTTLNPGFADPENGDFTVSNEDLILFGIGDPRWLP
jgi:hypothetical protein